MFSVREEDGSMNSGGIKPEAIFFSFYSPPPHGKTAMRMKIRGVFVEDVWGGCHSTWLCGESII